MRILPHERPKCQHCDAKHLGTQFGSDFLQRDFIRVPGTPQAKESNFRHARHSRHRNKQDHRKRDDYTHAHASPQGNTRMHGFTRILTSYDMHDEGSNAWAGGVSSPCPC